MNRRLSGVDLLAALAVVLGVIAVFVPWYSYSTSTAIVSVDGFRASVLGDLFYLAIAAMALVLLIRRGAIDAASLPRIDTGQALVVLAGAALASVLLQFIVDAAAKGRAIGAGLVLGLLSALTLAAAAWFQRTATLSRPRRLLEDDTLE